MKLFGRLMLLWVFALSAGGAYAVSGPFTGPIVEQAAEPS